MIPCQICGNAHNNSIFLAHEMTLGNGEQFEYVECSWCKSLKIKEEPQDISKYYRNSYFKIPPLAKLLVKKWLKGRCISHSLENKNLIGRLLSLKYNIPPFFFLITSVTTNYSRVLDIGCGIGDLLLDLKSMGYRNLLGIDPYIDKTINYFNKLCVQKCFLEDIIEEFPGKFDLVILNHSLEHMSNHKEVFQNLYYLLKPGGHALIRTPLANTYAWRTYGVYWVQLDAPRHLCIQSEKSLRLLAEKYGFGIEKVIFDSTSFQFTGSERYQRGFGLDYDQGVKLFAPEELQYFESKARYLNAIGDGDQATFLLKKLDYTEIYGICNKR